MVKTFNWRVGVMVFLARVILAIAVMEKIADGDDCDHGDCGLK